ncbi:hypothetical protein DY000_02045141 [Brassica cretica]|uniref:DUF7963 domain-containing protein n=1 Tax=Brassica cretica TaxID=69181 RepID=A0ABQ7ENH3_BRACR|nr:hypothetical protein DY000_02045141 [Brassica cretica]
MATTNNAPTAAQQQQPETAIEGLTPEELTAKALSKRYEGLMTVRNKAVKGKGAWYWTHLEPILVRNTDTGLPKAVKLRCSLCDAVFSASNPSRTASEHLKRGTCPNFTSSSVNPSPSSSSSPSPSHHHRKRNSSGAAVPSRLSSPHPITVVDPSRFCGGELQYSAAPPPPGTMLSGGRDDLVPLAMLEDSVKKLKSPKPSHTQSLTRSQRLAKFVNSTAGIRNAHCKYQLREHGEAIMLRLPPLHCTTSSSSSSSSKACCYFEPLFNLLEDVLSSARAIQLVMHDEACKAVLMEDHVAREVVEMVGDGGFWNEVEAVHALIKLVKEMARRIEEDKLLVGQCLPLWDELRAKIKDWDSKFNVGGGHVDEIVERRFKKCYHPAWAAAFILDPLYLIRDSSGKYLPPFKCLTPEQEKDVDKLITRLVSRDEAHIALMELMKWRTEGLDPMYARAVQMKERDPVSGKMRIANPQSSRLVWETYLSEFRSLGKVAVRLIFLHATTCGFKCNSSLLKWVSSHGRSHAAIDRAQKLIFISANSKFERRDFSNEEDRDAELLAMASGDDNLLNDVLVDTSSA